MDELKKVGVVKFDTVDISVWKDVNEPLFMARELMDIFEYANKKHTTGFLSACEADEKLALVVSWSGQRRKMTFVTERGLYSLLEQSRLPFAKKWRRVINDQLINMRKAKCNTISQQFDEWSQAAQDLYFDDEAGILMQSITIAGGDVDQIPYDWDEDCFNLKGVN